jgi:hypothetical protein
MSNFIQYLTSLGPYECIGVLGLFTYITAFGAVQLGWLDGNSNAYTLLNVLAASLVAVSLLRDFNLASALIQGSWIVIGLFGLSLPVWKSWPSTRRVLNATLEAEVQ